MSLRMYSSGLSSKASSSASKQHKIHKDSHDLNIYVKGLKIDAQKDIVSLATKFSRVPHHFNEILTTQRPYVKNNRSPKAVI